MAKKFKKLNLLFTQYNFRLMTELVAAEFKTYENNSALGIFWGLLNPALTLIIMFCVFERKFGHHIDHYPLFLLIGVVFINFFIDVTTSAFRSIFYNQNVILNTPIPRVNFILVPFIVQAYRLFIQLFCCCLLSAFYGVLSWPFIFLVWPLLAAYAGLIIGIDLMLSLLFCLSRDIDHIWRIASRLFLFISPVFYTLDQITPFFRGIIYWANPLSPFLIAFRQIIIWDNTFNVLNYLYSLVLGASFLIAGYSLFIIFENIAVEIL